MSASGELSINALIRQCWQQANLSDGLPHRMDNRTAKVLSLLARCRRGELGARRHDCPECGSSEVTINACHDRHCPLCAKQSRYVWEKQVMQWSLDCDYLHLVVTLPHEFNPLVAANPGPLLRLLQVCARDAVLWLARQHGIDDPGLILVLHTWGQRLNHHFHVHTVMTAGGLCIDQNWIMIDQDLLASQHALLADKFKKLYMRRLRRLLSKQLQPVPTASIEPATLAEEGFTDSSEPTTCSLTPHPSSLLRYPLEQPDQQSIEKMLSVVEAKQWVADIGVTPQEFRNRGLRKNSIRYVGAYVAGSAIGDGRLVSQTEDRVTFRIFDYRSDQYTNLEMSKIEFVQAYARHILPSGLRRVRFVGLFRPRGRPARLDKCRELIHQALAVANPKAKQHAAVSDEEDQHDENELKMGVFCSKCQAKMEVTGDFEGPMTCWMLNVSMLVVAWLIEHRIPAVPLSCDAQSIARALKAVVDRLQEEAWNRDHGRSLELSRCAGMTPGDLFYNEAHHQFLLILIAQQIQQQQTSEDQLAQRLSLSNHTTRGPPSAKRPIEKCSSPEVQSST